MNQQALDKITIDGIAFAEGFYHHFAQVGRLSLRVYKHKLPNGFRWELTLQKVSSKRDASKLIVIESGIAKTKAKAFAAVKSEFYKMLGVE